MRSLISRRQALLYATTSCALSRRSWNRFLCSLQTTKLLENAWKRSKLETLTLLLKGALNARDLVGLKMNLEEANLKNLLEALPALRNPTVSPLAQSGWVAVETVIEEKVVREIIPRLKALGAEGIIEYPLNKVVY